MKTDLVPLAVLMALATYPWRVGPLLVPGLERLPAMARTYTRLLAPATLASLAAVSVAVQNDPAGRATFHVGAEWLAVAVCVAVVAWRRNLLVGLILAAAFIAALRLLGLAPIA